MSFIPLEPLEPIEIHHYYACSWIINHHGLNQLADLAAIAEEMDMGLRVRRMFTDQYGYVMYPFTVKVTDADVLREFVKRVAAGIGMEEWYIVNISYYEQGVDFTENLKTVLKQVPLWEQYMRKYADHNAELHAKQTEQASTEGE